MMNFILNKIIRKKNTKRPRKYIKKGLSVVQFFEALNQKGARYVVLRWYDTLPAVKEGEDIDILIDDLCLEKIDDLVVSKSFPGAQPIDVYSTFGSKGTSFRGISYYPPHIAKQILDNSVLLKKLFRVPSGIDAFYSLAYHVVYHKGEKSGLCSRLINRDHTIFDHDYIGKLNDLSIQAGLQYRLTSLTTLEQLHTILVESFWAPSLDTLDKLSVKNNWIKNYILDSFKDKYSENPGCCVFIIREEGVVFLEDIKRILIEEGFDLILDSPVDKKKLSHARKGIRGGNWSKGPWLKSGGDPQHFIVAYDLLPLDLPSQKNEKYPGLTNYRLVKTKNKVRDFVNNTKSPESKCNVIHSSDNAWQAYEYINILCDSNENFIQRKIDKLKNQFKFNFDIVKKLPSNRRRSQILLVNLSDRLLVAKCFKPGYERFLKRELAIRDVARNSGLMLDVVDFGENYFLTPYIKSAASMYWLSVPGCYKGLIKPKYIKQIIRVVSFFKEHQIQCVDLKPDSFLIDENGCLKLIDMEFFCNTENFTSSYAFNSYKPSDVEDMPIGKISKNPYKYRWENELGIPKSIFIKNPPAFVLVFFQLLSFAKSIFKISIKEVFRLVKKTIKIILRALLR